MSVRSHSAEADVSRLRSELRLKESDVFRLQGVLSSLQAGESESVAALQSQVLASLSRVSALEKELSESRRIQAVHEAAADGLELILNLSCGICST